jgi:hypothetical protein
MRRCIARACPFSSTCCERNVDDTEPFALQIIDVLYLLCFFVSIRCLDLFSSCNYGPNFSRERLVYIRSLSNHEQRLVREPKGQEAAGHANIALNVRQHNHSQTRIVLVQTGYARRNPTDTEPGNAEIGIKPPLCAQQQTQHMKKSLYAHHGDRKDLPAGTSQCYSRSGQNGEDTDDSIRAPSFQKSKTTENARHAWRRNGREQGYVKHMMLAGRSWNFNWKGINPNRSCGIKVDWAPTASSQLPNQ